MKLKEIIEPKPTDAELAYFKSLDHTLGSIGDPETGVRVHVAANQKKAFTEYITAKLREMDVNINHIAVSWASARHATAFPTASIRVIVMNKKSELYAGSDIANNFPTVVKALIKNAFRDVFGFKVKVEPENVVSEYSNGLRYIDHKVDWA